MIGHRYLHGLPPGEAELFESQLGGLVFSVDLVKNFDFTQWKRTTHEILPVRDVPLDGLGKIDAGTDLFPEN